MQASLYLIPVTLGDTEHRRVLPEYNRDVILGIRHFIVENVRTARRFLDHLSIYGTDAELIRQLVSSAPDLSERLHPDYPYTKGEIIWLIRNEMALTLEDLLARRLRILFLDARAALAMASKVAIILAQERGKDQAWADEQIEQFKRVAANYIL